MRLNKRGYIHWLIPVTLLLLIVGMIVAVLMKSTAMAVFSLLVIGGAAGHVIHMRSKLALFSLHAMYLAFAVGFVAYQDFIPNITVFIIFYAAMIGVFYGEKAIMGK